jgi:SAM-dependent methyltransferase
MTKDHIYKLSIGCGPKAKKEYINLDVKKWDDNVDVIHDLTERPYPFADNYFKEVSAIEVLEHISFRQLPIIVKEVYRILEKGGTFYIQVPDCGKMMEYYVNKKICDCVENKPLNDKGGKPSPWCSKCNGEAMVHPTRWLIAFTGAQKHEADYHLNFFTKERMSEIFDTNDWELNFEEDPRGWKLKLKAIKK